MAESGRIKGNAHARGRGQPGNHMHASHIGTGHVVFIYFGIFVTTMEEKEARNLRESQTVTWEGLEGRKGAGVIPPP